MPRPALARLAAACAVAVPAAAVALAPAPAAADDPLLIYVCTTETLDPEEVHDGATVDIDCDWVDPEDLFAASQIDLVGTHYAGLAGSAPLLNVYGSCGGSIGFGSTDPWNNIISSTRIRTCGTVKHYDNSNLTGDMEDISGGPGTVVNLTYMDNRTSSIYYEA